MNLATHNVDEHFTKCEPQLRDVFSRFMEAVETFGPVRLESKKTSIHICNRTAFAGVRVMRKCIALTIKSDRDIDDSRFVRHEQTSANRWHLDVKLHSADDIDEQLLRWLRNAYDLSS